MKEEYSGYNRLCEIVTLLSESMGSMSSPD